MGTFFEEKLYNQNYNNSYDSCQKLIDWTRENPHTWNLDDLKLIKDSNCMFARKFDYNIDKEIGDYLYNYLK